MRAIVGCSSGLDGRSPATRLHQPQCARPCRSQGDKGYIQEITGVHLLPFIYLGAKHMVTGYDHLLFLFGVIFFLYRLKHIAIYVSLFALGHSTTMLLGVYFNIERQHLHHRRDHRPLGRLQGARQHRRLPALVRVQPNTKAATLIFGLFHGFGLATKISEYEIVAGRPDPEPARLQCRRRDRPAARARRHPDRHGLLAPHRELLAPRLHRQRRDDDRRLRADRVSADRLVRRLLIKDRDPCTTPKIPTRAELPTSGQLIRSTVIAAATAAAMLVTTSCPAEYGIDPTGVGRMLGLTEMGEIKASTRCGGCGGRARGQGGPDPAPAPALRGPVPDQRSDATAYCRSWRAVIACGCGDAAPDASCRETPGRRPPPVRPSRTRRPSRSDRARVPRSSLRCARARKRTSPGRPRAVW